MARRIDFSALTRAERAVIVAGALLFANGFVPWWYRVITAHGSFTYNAGLTGLSTVAVVCGAICSVGVLLRAMIWPDPAPRADGLVYTALGVTAVIALLTQLATESDAWIGPYVGIALSLALTGAGLRRRRERRSGWI